MAQIFAISVFAIFTFAVIVMIEDALGYIRKGIDDEEDYLALSADVVRKYADQSKGE